MRNTWPLAAFVVACVTKASVVGAQDTRRDTKVLVGLGGAVYATNDRGGSTMGLGASLGIERLISQRLTIRAVASGLRTVTTRDDAFGCPPAPAECSIAVFPEQLLSGELLGLVSPGGISFLKIVAGAGLTIPRGGRENWRGAPRVDSMAGTRATFRGGIELSLGRSPAAPRLLLTRSGYSKAIFSMDWLDGLSLVIPLTRG